MISVLAARHDDDEGLYYLFYNLVMSITTLIQIHIQIQAASSVSDTNGFIIFWLWPMVTRE